MAERWALPMVVLLGLVLRAVLAFMLTPHIDEAASVLAVQQVATTGFPFLPSGTLYLQGATLSYLYAPLHWVGLGGLDFIWLPRLFSVACGTGVVAVVGLIGRRAVGPTVGLMAALLVAIDPLSAEWSAHIRPYALSQLIAALMVWRFQAILLDAEPRRSDLVAIPALVALGTFTHVGILLIVPGLALAAMLVFGKDLLGPRRDVFTSLLLCGLGPLAFFGVNSVWGVSSAGESDGGGGVSFVGNHLLSLQSLASPSLLVWRSGYQWTGMKDVVQVMVLLATGIALWHAATDTKRSSRVTVALLFVVTWPTIFGMALLTSGKQPRYILHVHGFELALVALGVWHMAGAVSPDRAGKFLVRGMAAVISGVMVGGFVNGLYLRLDNNVVAPVYEDIFELLRERHNPGEPILVAMPPVAWLELEHQRDELMFLAGPAGRERAERYTRADGDTRRDFWLGVESITSIGGLCTFMVANPRGWIAVDQLRLDSRFAYRGDMNIVIRNGASIVRLGRKGSRLSRIRAAEDWPDIAKKVCARYNVDIDDASSAVDWQ